MGVKLIHHVATDDWLPIIQSIFKRLHQLTETDETEKWIVKFLTVSKASSPFTDNKPKYLYYNVRPGCMTTSCNDTSFMIKIFKMRIKFQLYII